MNEAAGRRNPPKSIVVVDDHTYLKLLSDPSTVKLLENTTAMIMPVMIAPMVNERYVTEVRDLLDAQGRLTDNVLLVKNPYDETSYEQAESAVATFAGERYDALGNVVRLLGARELRLMEAKVDNSKVSWDANLKVKIPVVGAGGKANRDVIKRLAGRLDARMTFEGGQPNPEAARKFMREHRLDADPKMNSLVQMRENGPLLTTYAMTFNGSSEASTNLDIALKVAAKLKLVKVDVSFDRATSSISSVEISTEITF
jgi:hypothetical protein